VSANKTWREHCEKEAHILSFNEKFAITNLKKSENLTLPYSPIPLWCCGMKWFWHFKQGKTGYRNLL